MIVWNNVEEAIYDWVFAKTSIATIWENPNIARPNLPYIYMNIENINRVGVDYIDSPTPVGTPALAKRIITGNREFSLKIGIIGANIIGTLENLITTLEQTSVQATYFGTIGLVYVDVDSIVDLTQIENTKFIQRREASLTFRIAQISEEVDVGNIEKTTLTGTFKKGTVTVFEDTININS